jgi:exodeoxyribonuclease VII large subunit
MRRAGLGALYEAFERLKAKLEREGLFDPARKRELPRFPRVLGIVTSPRAAALRDVLTVLARRMPGPAGDRLSRAVQGEGAGVADRALPCAPAGNRCECDVLIVCRGGGSIEDLWGYNDETLARAIAACPIPVVSGVGHETDFTIADFVADVRAPTPTAAAQLAVPTGPRRASSCGSSSCASAAWSTASSRTACSASTISRSASCIPAKRCATVSSTLRTSAIASSAAGSAISMRRAWSVRDAARELAAARPDLAALAREQGELARRLTRRGAVAAGSAAARLSAMDAH